MKVFFVVGWLLIGTGFLTASLETSAKIAIRSSSPFLPAIDLWRAQFPDSLAAARDAVEAIHPFLWDPVIVGLMILPAWLLLGLPGAVLVWFGRPNRHKALDDDGAISPHSLYEDLAKAAKEEGFDKTIDDMAPNVKSFDWAKDDPAQSQARRTPHEDMGEESARFADELSKRAAVEGYLNRDTARSGQAAERPTMVPPPSRASIEPRPTAEPRGTPPARTTPRPASKMPPYPKG
jgi:hypothetical protein